MPSHPVVANRIPWFQFDHEFGCHLRWMVREFMPQLKWTSLSNSLQFPLSRGDLSMQRARQLLRNTLGLDLESDGGVELSYMIFKRLESVLPKRRNTNQTLASNEPFFLLMQYYIYYCSNGTFVFPYVVNFLNWISDQENMPLFRGFLGRLPKLWEPTLEIFLHRLLLGAVDLEREAVVSSLLACGINPNYNNHPCRGYAIVSESTIWIAETITPLQLAVTKGNYRICDLLLKQGAIADAVSSHMPFSPLELAISVGHGNLAITERILAQDADIAHYCQNEIMEFIPKGVYSQVDDHSMVMKYCSNKTLLMKAVTVQNINIARLLLKRGASPNDISHTSGTALHIAIIKGDISMVELLLESGAEINFFDVFENSVRKHFKTHLEEYQRQSELMPWHLSSCEDYLSRNTEWGSFLSPIELATRQNNLAIAQRLVEKGAKINQPVNYSDLCDQIIDSMSSSEEPEYRQYLKQISKEMHQTILHRSITNGNVCLTKLLLQQGAYAMVNYRDGLGRTPLQTACGLEGYEPEKGQKALKPGVAQIRRHLMQLLVGFGADVNSPADPIHGRTALQAAAERGDQILVELLIQYGADINACPGKEGGVSTAEAAARSGNMDLVMWLVNYGAAVNDDIIHITFHSVAFRGDELATRRCLDLGVDLDAVVSPADMPGIKETVLQASVRGGNIDVVKLLLQAGADTNLLVQGETVLCTAAKAQNIEILNILLNHHADPNLTGTRVTPLTIACCDGSFEMVLRLLQAGSAADQLSQNPQDPVNQLEEVASPLLWLLCRCRNIDMDEEELSQKVERIGKLLLSYGADPNTGHEDKGNILTISCRYLSYSFVEYLIECGAKVHIPDDNGVYPIQVAPRRMGMHNAQLLQLLIDKGADVNAPSGKYGSNALDSALMPLPNKWTIDFLIHAGVHISDRGALLPWLIRVLLFELAINWIKDGVDVNCGAHRIRDEKMTALQAATKQRHLDLIELLLDRGANVNPPLDDKCCTPLQISAGNGNFNITKLLIERGADINAPASQSHDHGIVGTALQIAAAHGQLDIVHLLLENDNQIDTIESKCEDAAVIAEGSGHHVLARTLREYKPLQR